jgi:hypothetical protein
VPGAEDAVADERAGDHRRSKVRAFGRQRVVLASGVANDENLGPVDVCFHLLHFTGEKVVYAHDVYCDHAIGGGGGGSGCRGLGGRRCGRSNRRRSENYAA